MKKSQKNKNLILFCKVFSFITEYYNISAKSLCDAANGAFCESSVSSWRTRNPPGSSESFNELLVAMDICLKTKNVTEYYDITDYANRVCSVIKKYLEPPRFLVNGGQNSVEYTVKKTLEFAFHHKNMKPDTNYCIDHQSHELIPFQTKIDSKKKTEAVVFDFDGTLTTTAGNVKTTWESIWTLLGYSVDDCVNLHIKFSHKEISHEEWCLLTEEKFKLRRLHRDQLLSLVHDTQLIPGIEAVLKELDRKNIKVYIVSGSIKYIIRKVLGNLYQYVSGGVDANVFSFDEEGYLSKIIGTAYDFEGKAARITKIVEELKIAPEQILFVGNSHNDEWAYSSGARTLAINPKDTNMYNKNIWNNCIYNCESLTEILKYI